MLQVGKSYQERLQQGKQGQDWGQIVLNIMMSGKGLLKNMM